MPPLPSWIRDASRTRFGRDAVKLITFTALGQGGYFMLGPILGRIFSPEEFGLFGLFYTVAITASLFVLLQYDLAIPAADREEDAVSLTRATLVLAVAMSTVFGFFFAASSLVVPTLAPFPLWSAVLLGLILLGQAVINITQSWLVRRQHTDKIGGATVVLNLGRGVAQVVLGLFAPVWWALAVGELIGRILTGAYLWRGRFGVFVRRGREQAFASLREILHKYRQFPTILMPSQALDSAIHLLQLAALARIFGTEALGQYFMMRRALDVPVAFVSRSLGDLFYAHLAARARESPDQVRRFFGRAFLALFAGAAVAFLPLILFGGQLFSLIFGAAWREAGVLAAVMAPAMIMNTAVAPVSRVFALSTSPGLRWSFSIANLIGGVASVLLIWGLRLDLVDATAIISAAMFISYVVYAAAGFEAAARVKPLSPSAAG